MNIEIISLLVLLSILLVVLLTSVTKLNAFAALFSVSLVLALVALPEKNTVDILKQGFGGTISSIGFLILFGAIIAVVLEKSAAAASIASHILARVGRSRAATAMGITGYLVGLPIFCDSGYIILSGLAKSFSSKARIALPVVAFVLATSLYAVHNLTPTHPGSLAASGIMEAHLGMLILLGALFAIPASAAAHLWIRWQMGAQPVAEEMPAESGHDDDSPPLPPLFLSLLPIVVPLLLIALGSLLEVLQPAGGSRFIRALSFLGQPVVALLAGVLLSFLLLRDRSMKEINSLLESAIEKAGPILIVTGAGGMFGLVIRETGAGAYAGEHLLQTGLGLAIPFLIAAVLKTAQGSSTVAIITAASLVAPMLPALGLASDMGRVLTMLAMGSGSMLVSHANDSYFWVVSRFSGIDSGTTLKVYTSATVVMGAATFLCVWLVSFFLL